METKYGPLTRSAPSTNKRKSRWGERLAHPTANNGEFEHGLGRSVVHEDELSLKRYKQFRRGRSSSTCRYNRPIFVQKPHAEWRCIVCYLWNSRGREGCSRCGAFEGVDKADRSIRCSEPVALRRSNQPGQFQWPSLFETNGSDYVLDPRCNMFYDQSTDFFYDCKSNLYYSNKKKAYFRRIEIPQGHSFEQVSRLSVAGNSTKSSIVKSSHTKQPKIEIRIRSESMGATSPSLTQEPLGKRQKEQLQHVEKWNKQSLISAAMLPPPDASVGSVSTLPVGSIRSTTNDFLDMAEKTSQEILNTIHAHQSRGTISSQKGLTAVVTTAGGLPICILCNRKFASLDHLRRHEQDSELHKTNLSLKKAKELEVCSRTQQQAEPKYEDRAKKRRMLHGDLPLTIPSKRMESTILVPIVRPAVIDPEAAILNQHNVGNQIFQKMIAKSSNAVAQPTGLCQTIKEDWKRIENLSNPRTNRGYSQDRAKGLGF